MSNQMACYIKIKENKIHDTRYLSEEMIDDWLLYLSRERLLENSAEKKCMCFRVGDSLEAPLEKKKKINDLMS